MRNNKRPIITDEKQFVAFFSANGSLLVEFVRYFNRLFRLNHQAGMHLQNKY